MQKRLTFNNCRTNPESVFVPLVVPAQTVNAVLWSAALWSAGFALYAVSYWPVLTRVRIDGKPG